MNYRRIAVVGVTGSGKTTLAAALAARLGIPHVEMDALNWQRNWQPAERSEFRRRVDVATSGPAWVTDGNYSEVRDLVWGRADALVWLDYSLPLIQWRLLRRSLRRIFTREELWNGNRENYRDQFFSRESLFLYAFKSHPRLRRTIPRTAMQDYPRLKVIHLTHPRETDCWLEELTLQKGSENGIGHAA